MPGITLQTNIVEDYNIFGVNNQSNQTKIFETFPTDILMANWSLM